LAIAWQFYGKGSPLFGVSAARVEFAAGWQWLAIKARRGMIFLRIDFLATN
jgi:hypothetical protein